jgi:hypothetical protein
VPVVVVNYNQKKKGSFTMSQTKLPLNLYPKLNPEHIKSLIESVSYTRCKDTNITICTIKTNSGFDAVGYSSTMHSVFFNEEEGKKVAYDNALDSLYELEGYAIKRIIELLNNSDTVDEFNAMEKAYKKATVKCTFKSTFNKLDDGGEHF